MTAPILAHFDAQRPIIIESDALYFDIRAVLSQRDNEGRLHPVAFHSKKFQPAEINYEIHDKELLAIVDTFKHWHRYCEGAMHQIQVYSDHQNLEYFTTTKILNRGQARWAEELAGINFKIYYRPGNQNRKPNTLSRRMEYCPEKGGIENQPITVVLGKNHFKECLSHSLICSSARLALFPARKWDEAFLTQVRKEGSTDKGYQQTWQEQEAALVEPVPKNRKVMEGMLEIRDGWRYRKGLLCVPEGLIDQILRSEHNTKVAVHMGQDKTIELVRWNFW